VSRGLDIPKLLICLAQRLGSHTRQGGQTVVVGRNEKAPLNHVWSSKHRKRLRRDLCPDGEGPVENRISWQYYEWDQNKLILSALTHLISRLGSFVQNSTGPLSAFARRLTCPAPLYMHSSKGTQSPQSKLGSCSDHPFADFTLPNINICTPSQYPLCTPSPTSVLCAYHLLRR